MLDDDTVDNSPDVHVGPSDWRTCDLGPGEQGHGRSLVTTSHRHVVNDELAFGDEMVVIDSDLFTEVVLDHREDVFPTLAALRTSQIIITTCGMVDQVFGNQFVDDTVVTGQPPTKQLFDDILRCAAVHPLILP
jgi:hypothetical protein